MCVLTRNAAIDLLNALTCAPITRTIRRTRSEVRVGVEEGLPEESVITCDNIITIPKAILDSTAVGSVGLPKRAALDQALRYALDIQY